MPPITNADLTLLLAQHRAPCVSLYQPTQRSYPTDQQGPILYRNLVRQAEEAMRPHHPASVVQPLIRKFAALLDDLAFWTHRLDGLAVFGSPDFFHSFDLQRRMPERLVVNEAFHLKPLLRIAQSADRFQVLCLTREKVRMLQGNRDTLDEIPLNGVPATIVEALGDAVEAPQRRDNYRGSYGPVGGGTRPAAREPGPRPAPDRGPPTGHTAKGDDAKLDAERFFHAIDRAVWERHSRDSGLPLILVTLPQHQAMFHALSHNQCLLPGGVEHNPETLSNGQLKEAVWEFLRPRNEERLAKLSEDFGTARAHGQGDGDPAEVAKAAWAGRVGVLLVDADRRIPARFDPEKGEVRPADPGPQNGQDLLEDLAEQVLRTRGEVIVVPSRQMPTTTGAAAIFRY